MDLDQDNDLDIVVADSGNSGLIVYFENQDGEGTFSDRQILTNALIRPDKMVAYDFDNDGDQDILYHGNYNSKFYLLQNFGGAVFSDPILLIDGQIIEYLINWEMADLDGDGINDFIGSMAGWGIEEDLFWIKHIDGNGTFEQYRRPIYQQGDFWEVIDLRVIDLDLDGDLDIVLQAQFYLMWYENLDGQGTFGGAQEISWANNYSGLDITDVDGDERPDLLISAYISGEISWFRNVNFLDNPTIIEPELAFYPNPTHGSLTFVSEIPVDNIILLNGQGATIGTWEDINTLDLSQLRSGLYFARITLSNGSVITKKILKY
jgi:hypothetical protein